MSVHVKNLFFKYGANEILSDVNFYAPHGKFTVILGKNGSGKSTFLRLLAGLLPFRKGSIEIFGKNINNLSISDRAKLIGYLPQFHLPVFPFTVEEVVLTGRASYVFSTPNKKDIEKADEAMNRIGISHLRKKPYTEISGGERQLVMISRVIAQEPKIILLDEPLSHLDLSNQSRLIRIIKTLVDSGITIIAVLHDPNISFAHGDNFVFFKNGKIKEIGNNEKPWDSNNLKDVYDVEIETINYKDKTFVIPI